MWVDGPNWSKLYFNMNLHTCERTSKQTKCVGHLWKVYSYKTTCFSHCEMIY